MSTKVYIRVYDQKLKKMFYNVLPSYFMNENRSEDRIEMVSTRRVDINGRQIYDHDFVQSDSLLISEVIYDVNFCKFVFRILETGEINNEIEWPFFDQEGNALEVVGNKYDNPEFLNYKNSKNVK